MKLTKAFFDDIRKLIVSARTTAARGVDLVQVHTNFEIGRRIFEQEQKGKDRAAYGKEVIKALAERLTGEFGKGFSASNPAYMRSFYVIYQDRASIFQSVTGKLGPSKIFQSATGKSVVPRPATAESSTRKKTQTVSSADEIGQSLSDQFTVAPARPFTLLKQQQTKPAAP